MRTNVVFVIFKPNTHFEPAVLRDAAKEADTAFPLMQIVARGKVIEEGDQHFFIAGPDRFLLIEPGPTGTPLPAMNEPVAVIASLDDTVTPHRIKIVQTAPPEPPAAAPEATAPAGQQHPGH